MGPGRIGVVLTDGAAAVATAATASRRFASLPVPEGEFQCLEIDNMNLVIWLGFSEREWLACLSIDESILWEPLPTDILDN